MALSETVRTRVRFSEVDQLHVVWHGHYVKYMEDAREAFGRKYGLSYRHMTESGYYAPVFDMHLRFDRPACMDDVLLVTITWKPAIGAKLCFDYEIRRETDNAIILTASTIQLFTTVDGEFEPSTPEFYKEWKARMERETY